MLAVKSAIALIVACLISVPAWGRGNTSHFVDKLSCDSGPYSLKLPKTYEELRKIAPLKSEKLLREQDFGTYRARHRELVFNGLKLSVVTTSDQPETYQVTLAEIRSPAWKIAGPFRYGAALPAMVGDVQTKTLRSGATVEFSGEEDTVRVQLKGHRVASLTYLCLPD
jgi:hypothetical protein